MGLTFKENIPDMRNSKVFDIIKYLKDKKAKVHVFDHMINGNKFLKNILVKKIKKNYYDAIILAVAHEKFKKIGVKKIKSFGKKNSILVDIKNLFNSHELVDLTL